MSPRGEIANPRSLNKTLPSAHVNPLRAARAEAITNSSIPVTEPFRTSDFTTSKDERRTRGKQKRRETIYFCGEGWTGIRES
jgi:hypothetical protein